MRVPRRGKVAQRAAAKVVAFAYDPATAGTAVAAAVAHMLGAESPHVP